MLSTSRKAGFFLLGGADSTQHENSKVVTALPIWKYLSSLYKNPGGLKWGLLQHSRLSGREIQLPAMRFLVYSSLLCVLLLCFSIFSIEGKAFPWDVGALSGSDSRVWEGCNQKKCWRTGPQQAARLLLLNLCSISTHSSSTKSTSRALDPTITIYSPSSPKHIHS